MAVDEKFVRAVEIHTLMTIIIRETYGWGVTTMDAAGGITIGVQT